MSTTPDITGIEGERLDATVTVDSTFSSQQTQTIELRVEDGGTTIHTDTQDVTLADSTDSEQITLSWPTSSGDKGVYDLFLESDQDTIQRLVEVTDSTAPTLADNHWPFNEGGGSVAADTIGSFDADFGTAVSWGSDGDGNGGTYGVLDGSGGAVLGGTSDSHWSHWVNSGEGAIGVWIEPNFADQPDQRAGILSSNIEGTTGLSFAFHYEDTGNLEFQWEDSNNNGPDLNASVIQDATWQAVAVRADGSTVRMYHATASESALSEVASESVSNTESGDLKNTVQIAQDANPSSSNDRFAAGGIDDLWSDQSDPGEQAIEDWYNATKGNYP